jgi:AcrR family transcriptional regulator
VSEAPRNGPNATRAEDAAPEEPSRLGRRERQRLATRERIYQTAIEEFERVGFAAAQIDRIVERAGVARGTFYFHFRTKEQVLVELQHRLQDRYVGELAALGPPPESVAEFFQQIYDLVKRAQAEHGSLTREILAMYVRDGLVPILTDESLILHIVDYLSAAVERGAVRRDIPPEQLAIHFLTAMFMHFTSSTEPEVALESQRAKIDTLVKGMQP